MTTPTMLNFREENVARGLKFAKIFSHENFRIASLYYNYITGMIIQQNIIKGRRTYLQGKGITNICGNLMRKEQQAISKLVYILAHQSMYT